MTLPLEQNPAAPKKSVFGTIVLGSLAGALFLFAATASLAGYLLHARLSPLFESFLRRNVFTSPSRGTFERAGVNLFQGTLRIEGLSVPGPLGSPAFTAGAVEARVPLLSRGSPRELSLSLREPFFHWENGSATNAAPPAWAAALLQEAPPRRISFSGGTVEAAIDPSIPSFRLEGLDGLWEMGENGKWSVEGHARVPSDPPADISFKASFLGGDGNVDLEVRNLPWTYLAERLSASGEDIRFLSGAIDLKGSATLRGGLVTASPLIELRDLKLEVPVEKRTFAGFSVEKLRQVMEVKDVSFTVPVSGRWTDPTVGFSVTIEQMLDNALRDKIPDDRERAKLAHRGGWWLGGKADRAFKDWLSRRRGGK
jgi:hypothetical protein